MSAECAEPIESGDELDTSGGSSKLTSQQMQCVAQLRHWIENEADFYGNTDEEFLVTFLFGCKFNVEKAKTNITKYYENRRKFPKWWANRDVRDEKMLLSAQLKLTVALKDIDENRPSIVISMCGRLEKPCDLDHYLKFQTIVLETILRRRNCQANGIVWIVDAKDCPLWLITKMLSPFFLRNLLLNFKSMALRIESAHIVNSPPISMGIWPLARALLSRKLTDRVFFYGSNLDELFSHVAIEDVPEEYGGHGGPFALHEDAFTEEVLTLNDNIVDDNKYGCVQ